MKRVSVIFTCLCALTSTSIAAELKVIAVGSVNSSLQELIPDYERISGNKVQVTYGNPGTTVERLRNGEPIDVAIVALTTWDAVLKLGRIDPASKVDIAKTEMGVVVKVGAKKPDISNATTFKQVMLDAQSVGLGDLKGASPPTTLLMKALAKIGIANEVEAKAKIYPTGGAIAQAVSRGEVEFGVNLISELLSVSGTELVGPVPTDLLQFVSVSAAVITNDTSQPKAAKDFIEFLRSPKAKAVFKSKWMSPD